jgi:ribonuclease P protein subunit RPR2
MMPKRAKKKTKVGQREIAMERVGILFNLADDSALSGDFKNADSCVEKARKIAMRYKLRIPREYTRKFCKYCYRYLLPSVTSVVRINSMEHRVEVKCLECGRCMFYPFIKELKERRKNEGTDKDTADRKTRDKREYSR